MAPTFLVLRRDFSSGGALDDEDAQRVHGEAEQGPDEELRLGGEVRAEACGEKKKGRNHGRALQGSVDVHPEDFDVEGR